MQLLCVHAEAFGFDARNPDPELDAAGDRPGADLGGAVVLFVAVERRDRSAVATTAREAAGVVGSVTDQLNTEQVAVVPCRQLTDSPADREQAAAVIEELAARIDHSTRVPIGWDVAFDIETRAHPFAVQGYRVSPGRDRADSEWLLYREGSVGELPTDSLGADRAAVLEFERDGTERAEPAYLATVPFGLFAVGDSVSLRPRGVLARDRLESFVSGTLAEFGAVPVDRLGAGGRRESGTGGPDRLFESRTAPGELADHRLPAATVPELSAPVADLPAAFAEAASQAALVHRLRSALGLSYEPVLRVRSDGLESHADAVEGLAAAFGRPVLIERRTEADWLLKLSVHTLADGEPVTTPTVLIEDGDSGPVVRSLPAGAIERTLGAVLASLDGLPAWLAPVQLRLVPIEPAHLAGCERLADRFEAAGVRPEIDDRDTPVRERLAAADEAGIPYYAVVGDAECETGAVDVIDRRDGSETKRSPAELRALIDADSPARPTGSLLPRYVSEY